MTKDPIRVSAILFVVMTVFVWCVPALVPGGLVAGTYLGVSQQADWPSIRGLPDHRYFEAEVIGSLEGINALGKDRLGRLMVSSGTVIILYDGSDWTHYQLQWDGAGDSAPTVVFELVEHARTGLLASTDRGLFRVQFVANLKYRLLPLVDEASNRSSDVRGLRQVLETPDAIYFYSRSSIFEFNLEQRTLSKLTSLGNSVTHLSYWEGRLQMFGDGGDSYVWTGEDWVPLDETLAWSSTDNMRASAPLATSGLILARSTGGLFQLDGLRLVPWESEIDGLNSHRVEAMQPVGDCRMVVAVQSEGVFILNKEGLVEQAVTREMDYRFGQVEKLLYVGDGMVWGSTGKGLVQIYFLQPLTHFLDLYPRVRNYPLLISHDRQLYAFSGSHLMVMETFEGGALRGYRPAMHSDPGDLISVLSTTHGLFAMGNEHLIEINPDGSWEATLPISDPGMLIPVPGDPDLLIVAGDRVLRLLQYVGDRWEDTGHWVPGVGFAHFSRSDDAGTIWVELGPAKVAAIVVRDGTMHTRVFGPEDGLLPEWTNLWSYRGKVLLSGGKGDRYLVWDDLSESLVPFGDAFIDDLYRSYPGVGRPALDVKGNLWVPTISVHPVTKPMPDGSWYADLQPLRALRNMNMVHVIPASDESVWLLGEKYIGRYDASLETFAERTTITEITEVESVAKKQLLQPELDTEGVAQLVLPYADRELILRVSSPTIDQMEKVHHEYRIEGMFSEWRAFPTPSTVVVSFPREGAFHFHVRARHTEGVTSSVSIRFLILAPWYRTLWAYILFGVLLVLWLWSGYEWVRWRAERKSRWLQSVVDQRTAELKSANGELKRLVRKADAAAIAKNTFLQSISHEMRTPLNAMLSPAELLVESEDRDERILLARLIRDSAGQLLGQVESVLSFVANEGNMPISEVAPFDIRELVEEIRVENAPACLAKGLDLVVEVEPGLPHYLLGDSSGICRCLRILVGNAIKFTDSGFVRVRISSSERWPRMVAFEVADSGIGVSSVDGGTIFDPFSQGRRVDGMRPEGTGLSLSVFSQLVRVMHGYYDFSSEPGVGSRFLFHLPLQNAVESKIQSGQGVQR